MRISKVKWFASVLGPQFALKAVHEVGVAADADGVRGVGGVASAKATVEKFDQLDTEILPFKPSPKEPLVGVKGVMFVQTGEPCQCTILAWLPSVPLAKYIVSKAAWALFCVTL